MPAIAPALLARFQNTAEHECREECRRRKRERGTHEEQDVTRLQRRHVGRDQRHDQQQDLGNRHPLLRRGVRVDHLVVHVMRERIRDRQQQAVGGRKRRRQSAGCDQAGDHVRQARDFRRGKDDDVLAERDFRQLNDAVLVDVGDAHQSRIDLGPGPDPRRQVGERTCRPGCCRSRTSPARPVQAP